MTPQEAGQLGGLATLAKHGRRHFGAITKGHPRRPRHRKEMLAGRSSKVSAMRNTTTRAKGEIPSNVVEFRPRAGSNQGPRPLTKGKVIPFGAC